jgi:hypothetical protein
MSERANPIKEALYEDISLRGELTDDEATPLLEWASAQVSALDAQHADEAQFQHAVGTLRGLVKSLNQFVGGMQDRSADDVQSLYKIAVSRATQAGYNADALAGFDPSAITAQSVRETGAAAIERIITGLHYSGVTPQASAQADEPPIAPPSLPKMPGINKAALAGLDDLAGDFMGGDSSSLAGLDDLAGDFMGDDKSGL